MRLSRLIVISTVAALVVGAGVAGGAAAQGPGAVSTGAGSSIKVGDVPPAVPVSAQPPTKPTVVTLVTGDQVRVDGQSVTPLGTTPSMLMRFEWGADTYAVPAAALPYLGSTLDMRLFDVSYLAQAGGTAPVTVTTTTGTAAPLAAGTTTLNAAQAQSLGARIKARNLTGIKRISLAQEADAPALPIAPATAAPVAKAAGNGGGLPYDTLTVNTIDRTGAAGQALIMVQNLTDPSLALLLAPSDGSARFSLPQGDYSVESSVLTADGDGFDAALVANPQLALRGDKTVTLDSRTAKPYLPTLDPSIPPMGGRLDSVGFTRTGAGGDTEHGGRFVMSLLSATPNPLPQYVPYAIYVAPTAKVHTGSLDFAAYTEFSDSVLSGGTQSGPAYVLGFPYAGIIPDGVSTVVRKTDLTTVDNGLDAGPDGGAGGYLTFNVYEPWGDVFEAEIQVSTGDRNDYWYSAAPDTERWQIRATPPDGASRYGALHQARPGSVVREVWNKGPMVPSPAALPIDTLIPSLAVPVGPEETLCPACRQDDNATLFLGSYGDSNPAHYAQGWGNLTTSSLRFRRNGALAATSAYLPGDSEDMNNVLLPMLHQRASYELDWSVSRFTDPAAVTDTDWTFTSAPQTTTRLPGNEQCTPDASRACAALPLLFVNYDLALDHQSQAPTGAPFTVAFRLGYQQGAPAATGLGATLSVSFDDGQTWSTPRSAHATGNGQFSLGIQHPDSAGSVSLRVEAHDAAGNAVRQTVIRAYRLASQ